MRQRKKFIHAAYLLAAAIGTWGLAGCGQQAPTAYKIPKEDRNVTVNRSAASQESTASGTASGDMQPLPGMSEAADAAGTILYTVPKNWNELEASGIRKVHVSVADENGQAELTVTAFPGDVGGTLANINRWLGQLQQPPITEDQLTEVAQPISIFQHQALYVTLDGGVNSILAAILPFHGYTWFVKLQGSSSTVFDNEDRFKEFLASIEMEGHAH